MPRVDFHLYVITDRLQCNPRELTQVIEESCQAGVKAFQLREKDLSAKDVYSLALEINNICKTSDSKLFINERFDVAGAVGADGVHLSSKALPLRIVKENFHSEKLIGVSTHSIREAQQAEDEGADLILFGPVYETPSKASYGDPQGLDKLDQVVKSVRTPVFAIGGVSPERAKECLKTGAFGVAVISSVMSARDIPKRIKKYEENIGNL